VAGWRCKNTASGFRAKREKYPRIPHIKWQKYLDEARRMFGKKLNVASEMAAWMGEVGFDDAREETIKVRFLSRATFYGEGIC
jgi:hypothetical protein